MPPTEASLTDRRLLSAYAQDPTPRNLEALVERYQRLAHSLARRYGQAREPFEDLLQVANLGLVKAIKGYDASRGMPFTAYAVPTILGELRRHFRDKVWNLRLPRGLQESSMTVERAIERLTGELGRSPTVRELATETGYAIEDVNETLIARETRWTESMEMPLSGVEGEQGIALGETLGSIDAGYDRVEAEYAAQTAELDEREWEILKLRFEDGMRQKDIAKRFGISQMQVSRVSRRALAKLLGTVQGDDGPVVLTA
jgi:RNA polymerase sigma-B factor